MKVNKRGSTDYKAQKTNVVGYEFNYPAKNKNSITFC